MKKYKDSLYPDKINDLIDNDGNVNAEKVEASGIAVLKVAPTADNTDGDIKFVQLDEEPAERFNGYYYLIGSGESPKTLPVKGDIIPLDLGDELGIQYFKVLKIQGSVAELMAIRESEIIRFNASPVIETFTDGTTGQKYADGTLDTFLNTTWYGKLSTAIKAAIVPQTRVQDMWWTSGTHEGNPSYIMTYVSQGQQQATITKKLGATLEIGSRNVYTLSVQDMIDYLEKEEGETITEEELYQWTEAVGSDWFSSALANVPYNLCYVSGRGFIDNHGYNSDDRVRPAFSIDLSKLN